MTKRYLFYLSHPAHYHLFKNIITGLKSRGHKTIVLINTKDILETLCAADSFPYVKILSERRKNNYLSIIISFLLKYIRISKIIKRFNPELLIGSEPTITHIGVITGIPSIIFSEDDVDIIPQFAKITYPFVNHILSPLTCNAGKWEYKKIGYDGFHKFAYLHPSVFTPNRSLLNNAFKEDYFILRLAELSAYHDKDRSGLDRAIVRKLITLLQSHGKVFITSERELEPEFEKYRLNINPLLIHHVLYYAKLYIGDSQSMAVEAALLGTVGIRFNDFAGEIGVLKELENVYKLTTSIRTNEPEKLLNVVEELISNNNIQALYDERRAKLIHDKINAPSFFIWLLENYPESTKIVGENANYPNIFR